MPKPISFSYEKKPPFRDAFLFIIVCEGSNREPEYFRFFDGMSSRVKVVPVPSENGSAPKLLIDLAIEVEKKLDANSERDRVWFVIDTDRWRQQLHLIRIECEKHPHWKVAQSNPCFEVWLYFHAKAQLPVLEKIDSCNNWKPYLPTVIQGGFNTANHPVAIETAILNSKAAYQSTGYFPNPGSTQLWELGEELLHMLIRDLEQLKPKFQFPVII